MLFAEEQALVKSHLVLVRGSVITVSALHNHFFFSEMARPVLGSRFTVAPVAAGVDFLAGAGAAFFRETARPFASRPTTDLFAVGADLIGGIDGIPTLTGPAGLDSAAGVSCAGADGFAKVKEA